MKPHQVSQGSQPQRQATTPVLTMPPVPGPGGLLLLIADVAAERSLRLAVVLLERASATGVYGGCQSLAVHGLDVNRVAHGGGRDDQRRQHDGPDDDLAHLLPR